MHALQGSEREYIILSFVRSVAENPCILPSSHVPAVTDTVFAVDKANPALRQICESNIGILADNKLLTVALTRAKQGLFCVGNRTALSGGSQDFAALTEDLDMRGCLVSCEEFPSLGRGLVKS